MGRGDTSAVEIGGDIVGRTNRSMYWYSLLFWRGRPVLNDEGQAGSLISYRHPISLIATQEYGSWTAPSASQSGRWTASGRRRLIFEGRGTGRSNKRQWIRRARLRVEGNTLRICQHTLCNGSWPNALANYCASTFYLGTWRMNWHCRWRVKLIELRYRSQL